MIDIDRVKNLRELIQDASENRQRLEVAYAETEARLEALATELGVWRADEANYRSVLERISPESVPPAPEAAAPADLAEVEDEDEELSYLRDWSSLPRTVAVEDAVREVLSYDELASPAAVEHTLRNHRRNDTRDEVGSALSYLSRKKIIYNHGRGQWALTPAEQTSEDTADTVPSDLQKAGEREEV